MATLDHRNTETKIMLGVLAGVVAAGVFGLPAIYADMHNVLVQVRNNATGKPEVGANCTMTFLPLGNTTTVSTVHGGIAKTTAPPGNNSTNVSCMGHDLTFGIFSNATLKAHGTTVIEVLTH